MLKKKKSYLIPVGGFALIIIICTFLLLLPICNNKVIAFKDALFTAISAVTCTGFTKSAIPEQFNFLGQFIMVIAMEIGALGFIIFISYLWAIKGKKIQMSDIMMINDNISGDDYSAIKEYSIFMFRLMLRVQIAGIILLCFKFIPDFGFFKGIWYSTFHTVAAFANAGFDLIGANNLMKYKNDVYLQTVLIILMILGSIGIFAIEDLKKHKLRNFNRFKLQTKIILVYSAILIVLPTVMLKILEPSISVLNSLFMSASARSTGLAITSVQEFSQSSKILMIILMFIGGSPASTAGGVRIVSTAIILSTVFSTIRGREHTIMFWKEIPASTVRKAFTTFLLFIVLLSITTMFLAYYSDLNLLNIVFESVSAVTNTGLTITDINDINLVGDAILMLLMFIGRVGPLTLILVFINEDEKNNYLEYPSEDVIL